MVQAPRGPEPEGLTGLGHSVWVIGHGDQMASTIVSRAIHHRSASVRSASPTSAIAASSSAAATAQASAAALWRVVMRDGIEGASIRRVAAEAGWSSGALRHYFDTQPRLLAFAMELVVECVTGRVRALRADDHAGRLAQLLPLDAERRAEVEVWLAFTARALVDPELRPLRDEAHAALRELCRAAAGDGAEALHALVDGLALHGILAPDVTTPARQLELLREQLERAREPSAR